MRTIHKLAQGSPEWDAHRAHHFNASEASAMMGLSPHVSRSDLVKTYALGVEREVSARDQERFDDGHSFEAMARPWAEEIVGEALYPITASLLVDGLPLSASYDGTTIGEDVTFEHKSLNADLDAALARGEIPHHYKPQLEQQLLILGAEKCLFMASRGSRETMRFAWYTSDPAIRAALLAGWRQFDEDVTNYQHVEVIPKAVAEPTMALPALSIDVKGDIALASNLDLFGEKLRAFIEAIDKKPSDDQGFANAEAAVKTLQTAQERLEAAEAAALARFTSIDEMRRTVAMYADLARSTRLMLEKVVKARKEEIRGEILRDGQQAFAAHHEKLNQRFGRKFMPTIPTDFAGAMRGKKTVASLRDAVAVELSRAKIEANAMADQISANLKALGDEAAPAHLFADLDRLVVKAPEDFVALVRARVTEHRAAEERRIEAERARIREEEATKLRAEEDARQHALAQAEAARSAQRAPNVNDDASARLQRDLDRECRPKPTMPAAKARPTDDEIIDALCTHYRVHESQVIAWLLEVDLEAASKRLVKQFAA